MLLEKNRIIELLNNAEKELETCYDYLLLLRSKKFNGLEEFQPKLADTLYGLSNLYEKIKDETRNSNNNNVLDNQKEYQLLLKAIRKLIKIGKIMGDLFAWFFYKDSPDKIQEHLKHQVNGLYTPRLGGIGEVEFLRNFQFVGGCLLILHANTNILRIADFSIFNPTDGIIGTIEIKTKKTDIEGQVDITAHVVTENTEISKQLYDAFANMNNGSKKEFQQPYILNRDRFEKQVILQTKLMNVSYKDLVYGKNVQLDTKLVENAYKSGISINEEKCIIAIVQKSANAAFFGRIYNSNNELPPIEILNKTVETGFCENNKGKYPNIVGKLKPFEILQQFAPMFFCDVDKDLHKDLLLEKITIYLLLNPTIFLEKFEKNGYEITVNKQSIIMSKTIKGVKVELDFNWLAHILTNRVLTVNCVLEIIDEVILNLEKNPNYIIKIQM